MVLVLHHLSWVTIVLVGYNCAGGLQCTYSKAVLEMVSTLSKGPMHSWGIGLF